jgi:uncharacterized protein (UPF0210 family)
MKSRPGWTSPLLFAILLISSLALAPRAAQKAPAKPPTKPKIRALTAFAHLDRAQVQTQIADALSFLRKLKAECEKAGYEVETIRITTQPFPEYTRELSPEATLGFFREYNALAVKEGFDAAIGPAMVADNDDPHEVELLAQIIASTTTLESSVTVAGEDGVHWKAVRAAAGVMKYLEDHTAHSQGNFNFTAAALVPPGTPFYPASYAGAGSHQFAIGLESANVVAEALGSVRDPEGAEKMIIVALEPHAHAIEAVAQQVAKETGWNYLGIDLSPAPLKEVSIGAAIERYTGARVGSSGTLAAAALITRALREINVTRTGYSGLMLPVLEDSVLAQRWSEGALPIDALLAYSSVCGTGLDVVPLPGEVSQEQLARIIGDVASLAVKLHKPLSARLLPVAGKKAGEHTEFEDPFLVNATLQPLP